MKRKIGRTTLVITFLAVFALSIVPEVYASGCADGTLNGKYGFEYTAFAVPGTAVLATKNSIHSAAVGALTFDGNGNLSAGYTLSRGGDISTATSDIGTYTVNADCTGSFTDTTAAIHFNMVIIGGGTEFFAAQTDAGLTAILDAKMEQGGCSNATLNGKYAFQETGFVLPGKEGIAEQTNNPIAITGVATFDGNGNLSLSYTFSDVGVIRTATYDIGTYTVNADCTGSFTDTTQGVHFNMVIAGAGAALFGIDTDDGLTTITVAKKQ